MKITVIGAGNSGMAMAAHLALNGHEVTLWNRTFENIRTLQQTGIIQAIGKISGRAKLATVTDHLAESLRQPDLILIATPATAHRELAIMIGRTLRKECPIILSPGRTCGAIEFNYYFRLQDNPLTPTIAETQTVIHTCRKQSQDKVNILALKDFVYVAGMGEMSNREIVDYLPDCIRPYFMPATSMIQTSIGNVGMILHCAPLLLNSGWIENPEFTFKYYRDSITPHIAAYIEEIDRERLQVAEALGFVIDSTKEWFHRTYHTRYIKGEQLYDVIRRTDAYDDIDAPDTLNHRYILEDVPYGLVPLETLGQLLDIETEYTSLIIDLASKLLRLDFRATGRHLKQINIQDVYATLLRIEQPDSTF
ncbi:MAG: NAD/NADP octopine/nopaline dehydrogenase family protein [Saccharofermentanales bacterium]|mgnify:CR=1 FL=1|jgi:opine dehydrogenase|nr:NAD/NADP octopine/nopaline dehydrogenase family protein [Bacillota bacterium]